jgi:hypothetical protein
MSNPYQSPIAVARPKRKRSAIATLGMACFYIALLGLWLIVKDIDKPADDIQSVAFALGELSLSFVFFIAAVVLLVVAAVRGRRPLPPTAV